MSHPVCSRCTLRPVLYRHFFCVVSRLAINTRTFYRKPCFLYLKGNSCLEISRKIFISAGESSGDIHGANLMRCLLEKNPNITFYGLGRENMAKAGLHGLRDMSQTSLNVASRLNRDIDLLENEKGLYPLPTAGKASRGHID